VYEDGISPRILTIRRPKMNDTSRARGRRGNKDNPALTEAIRAIKLPKGPPTTSDRPRLQSVKPHVLAEQLDIFGAAETGQDDSAS
jgi:hypothetical protein